MSQIYFKKTYDRDFGFDIQFPYERGKTYWLLIRCEGRQAKIKYNEELIAKRFSVAHKRMEKIKDLMNMETVRVAADFWKENGLKALIRSPVTSFEALIMTMTTASGMTSQSPEGELRPRGSAF